MDNAAVPFLVKPILLIPKMRAAPFFFVLSAVFQPLVCQAVAESSAAVVKLTAEKPNGQMIVPELFGHNLEHTRSAVYQGLSAELLRNRKFAGRPAAHSGEPPDWIRFGNEQAFITLVTGKHAYTKHIARVRSDRATHPINGVMIQNPVDGQETGIKQEKIAVKGGKEYKGRAVLTAWQANGQNVEVAAELAGEKKTLNVKSGDYTMYEFTFTPPKDDLNAVFSISFSQKACVKIGALSLLPAGNFHGMRKDVVEKMKEIGVKLLRWPGGNFAGEYYWKDGLLPVDQRAPLPSYQPMETQPHSHGYDFHEIGTDEFMALCKEIGAEPFLTLNLAWDSPEESAQWLKYCTDKGYGVKYWSLGNEYGYGHMEGLNSPEEYAKKARQTIDAMKKITPDLKFCTSGPNNSPSWRNAMNGIAEDISLVSFHSYHGGTFMGSGDFISDTGLENAYNVVVRYPDRTFGEVQANRAGLNKAGGAWAKAGISFDEWNAFYAWYHKPTVIEGVMSALMLTRALHSADELGMPAFMYFQPVNEGAIVVNPLDSELTATGQVYQLMKAHCGRERLRVFSHQWELPCIGSIGKDGKRIITVTNRHYREPRTVDFTDLLVKPQKITLLDGSGENIFCGSQFVIRDGEQKFTGTYLIPPRSVLQIEE
ncbi:MAG: hypothetical protein LBH00_11250 [Planctomycetaceae bacterium]|jgi:alpha-N-arabinofuranosidase|nr:hypothetical protein [Planctomycetaceae bacterium]